MRHRTFTWEAGHTTGKMFTQLWAPENETTQAVIALVHGQGEHSGRYKHIAEFFTQRDCAVMAVDLTGHGRSVGKRGHVKGYEDYLADVEQLLLQVKEQYAGLPVFLYGHSMGGNISLNYALRNPVSPLFDHVVITSPWLKLAFDPPVLKEALGKIVRHIYGGYTEQSTLDVNLLSRDACVPKAYKEDPLVHSKISVSAYFGILEAGEFALANAQRLQRPCLLMHGEGDRITSHKASQAFAASAPQELITYKEWEGLYHELHNEVEWEEVAGLVYKWMEKQIG